VGLAVGALVVATGGAGLVVGAAIIGGSVAAGAGIGELLGSLSFMGGSPLGAIASGSPDTFHNDLLIDDTWSVRGTTQPTDGGGIQY
jgi:hypothetical protein